MHTILVIFTFTCQHDQLVGVCSGRLKKGVSGVAQLEKGGAGPTRKGGILGVGHVKKGGLYRGTYLH